MVRRPVGHTAVLQVFLRVGAPIVAEVVEENPEDPPGRDQRQPLAVDDLDGFSPRIRGPQNLAKVQEREDNEDEGHHEVLRPRRHFKQK